MGSVVAQSGSDLVAGYLTYIVVVVVVLIPVGIVAWIVGRSVLKPTVKALNSLRIRLTGIEHAVGGTLADQVNEVAQQLYQVNARQTGGEVKR